MSRKIVFLLCIALITSALAGCSGSGAQEIAQNIDVSTLASQIAQQVKFDEPLSELDAQAAERAFRVDSEDVAAVAAWVGSGATVDEVSVWEGTDVDTAEAIEKELRQRLDTRKSDYADYKPDEVPKLDDAILQRFGKYVVSCVTPDADSARSIIEAAFKAS